jgi:hypothetical protein
MSTSLNDPNTSETITGANGQVSKPLIVNNYAGSELFSVDKDGNVGAALYGGAFDYNVFKSGTTTYAKSGATGEIVSSGTDSTVVIQAALDELKGECGVVNLCSGVYDMTDTVHLYFGMGLVSQMPAWYRNAADKSVGAVLHSSLDKPIISIDSDGGDSAVTWFPYIKNICVWGANNATSPNQHGISIVETSTPIMDVYLENVMACECGGSGIYAAYGGKLWINRGYTENNYGHGIYVSASSGGYIKGMYIYRNNLSAGAFYNIALISTGYGFTIEGNHIKQRGSSGDILTYSSGQRAIITGNYFTGDGASTGPAIDLQVNNKIKMINISNNAFWNYAGGVVKISEGAYYVDAVPYVICNNNFFQTCPTPISSADFDLEAANFILTPNLEVP